MNDIRLKTITGIILQATDYRTGNIAHHTSTGGIGGHRDGGTDAIECFSELVGNFIAGVGQLFRQTTPGQAPDGVLYPRITGVLVGYGFAIGSGADKAGAGVAEKGCYQQHTYGQGQYGQGKGLSLFAIHHPPSAGRRLTI